jgi:hypothetical protein
MPPKTQLKPDQALITSPGTITGNMLERLKDQRTLKQKNLPSLHLWVLISILGDLVMIVCAEHAAYWLRFHSFIREFGIASTIELRQYSGHMALGSLSLLLALGWQGSIIAASC